MTKKHLEIGTITATGKPLRLPMDIITQSVAILAKRRVGKSYLADVIAEELLAIPQQTVIVDPTGVHWGLRSSADGKAAGFPVVVFGGKHGDLPLEEGGGEVLARAVVEQRFSAIIDTSLLRKNQTLRFLDAFLGTLYHLNEKPMHLILDEVDYYCPQKPMGPLDSITTSHVDDLVRRGGVKGIGVTLITQRSAVVNKNVLTQCEVLMTLRLVHPADIKPVMEWIGVHGDLKHAQDMVKSLPDLPVGTAWFWWPAESVFDKVGVRKKTTFDSGRTPRPGERHHAPKRLAAIDLEVLGQRMKATIEAAKANDPKELRRQIAELQQQLRRDRERPPKTGAIETRIKTVKVPALKAAEIKRLERVAATIRDASAQTKSDLLRACDELARLATAIDNGVAAFRASQQDVILSADIKAIPDVTLKLESPPARAFAKPSSHELNPTAEAEGMTKPQLKLLETLSDMELLGIVPAPKTSLAALAGVSSKSSAYTNNLGRLRTIACIDYRNGDVVLTDKGRDLGLAPGFVRRPLLTLQDIHQRWLNVVTQPQARILRPLLDAYPKAMTKEHLAQAAEASPTSSAYTNNLGALRTLGAITYPEKGTVAASTLLFPPNLH